MNFDNVFPFFNSFHIMTTPSTHSATTTRTKRRVKTNKQEKMSKQNEIETFFQINKHGLCFVLAWTWGCHRVWLMYSSNWTGQN